MKILKNNIRKMFLLLLSVGFHETLYSGDGGGGDSFLTSIIDNINNQSSPSQSAPLSVEQSRDGVTTTASKTVISPQKEALQFVESLKSSTSQSPILDMSKLSPEANAILEKALPTNFHKALFHLIIEKDSGYDSKKVDKDTVKKYLRSILSSDQKSSETIKLSDNQRVILNDAMRKVAISSMLLHSKELLKKIKTGQIKDEVQSLHVGLYIDGLNDQLKEIQELTDRKIVYAKFKDQERLSVLQGLDDSALREKAQQEKATLEAEKKEFDQKISIQRSKREEIISQGPRIIAERLALLEKYADYKSTKVKNQLLARGVAEKQATEIYNFFKSFCKSGLSQVEGITNSHQIDRFFQLFTGLNENNVAKMYDDNSFVTFNHDILRNILQGDVFDQRSRNGRYGASIVSQIVALAETTMSTVLSENSEFQNILKKEEKIKNEKKILEAKKSGDSYFVSDSESKKLQEYKTELSNIRYEKVLCIARFISAKLSKSIVAKSLAGTQVSSINI